MKSGLIKFLGACLLVGLPMQTTFAQSCTPDTCGKVDVKFHGSFCADSAFSITMEGASSNGNGNGCGSYTSSSEATAKLIPEREQPYTMTVTGGKVSSVHVTINAGSCYLVYVDGEEKSSFDVNNTEACSNVSQTFSVELRRPLAPGAEAGESSGPSPNDSSGGGGGGGGGGGFDMDFGLGNNSDGNSAGGLHLSTAGLEAATFQPGFLEYRGKGGSEVNIIRVNGAIAQVMTHDTFVDIVATGAHSYEIRFYLPAQATLVGGSYQVTGSPFVVYTFENTDSTGATTDGIRITETRGGVNQETIVERDLVNGGTVFREGGNSRIESRSSTEVSPGIRMETRVVKNGSGTIAYKVQETYRTYAWGEELIKRVEDPDGAALTTTYVYEDVFSSTDPSYSRLKWRIEPYGKWERMVYASSGLIAKTYRPWKDGPTSPDAADDTNCRATTYTYASSGGFFAKTPTKVEERILGTLVSKTEFQESDVTFNGQPAEQRVEKRFTSANSFLPTTTVTYKDTAPEPFRGRTASVEHPDGQLTSYEYDFGAFDSGAGSFTPGPGADRRESVINGTKTQAAGVANKSIKETSIYVNRRIVRSETQVYTGSGYSLLTATTRQYDARGNLTETRENGRITYSAVYVDNRLEAETDETGKVTEYEYDSMGRPYQRTLKGAGSMPDVVTTEIYDAEGRTISETQAAGLLSLSTARTYDPAGRLKTSTDEAGLITYTVYPNNGRTESITHPGGFTAVTDSYLDGQVRSLTGTLQVAEFWDYGTNASGGTWSTRFVAMPSSPRWIKTTNDIGGRQVSQERPGYEGTLTTNYSYNNVGQQTRSYVPGAGTTIKTYDELGRVIRSGLDVDQTGALELGGVDHILETEQVYQLDSGNWSEVQTEKRYVTEGNSTPSVLSTVKMQRTGLGTNVAGLITSIDAYGNSTVTTTNIDRSTKTVTTTQNVPDSNIDAEEIAVNGLLQSTRTSFLSTASTYGYDALRRQVTTSTPENGTSTTVYASGTGRVERIEDALSQTTQFFYYPDSGRLHYQINPDSEAVYFAYNTRGQTERTWGSAAYPIEKVYNEYGENVELRTFRSGSFESGTWPGGATADVTKWSYQPSTGLVLHKEDAAGKKVQYSYDGFGRLATRTWARGLVTRYTYNRIGQLSKVDYSDATPDIVYTYDRQNKIETVRDGIGSASLLYTVDGRIEKTEYTSGKLSGIIIDQEHDSFGRYEGVAARDGTNPAWVDTDYSYDTSGRLGTASDGSTTVTYGYHPTRGLMSSKTFNQSSTDYLTTTQTYDGMGRVDVIGTTSTGGVNLSFDYGYDSGNRRNRVDLQDGSYWIYGYNTRGEVVSGKKYLSGGALVEGMQFEYVFDKIGNREDAKRGGDSSGANLRNFDYSPNNLNQYTQRTVPGYFDVLGSANASASVTVNGSSAIRQGALFRKEIAVSNGTGLVETAVNVTGLNGAASMSGTGKVAVPQTPESISYDDDGNLLSDGLWIYTWNGENRLIKMESKVAVPAASRQQLQFEYDSLGRRLAKRVYGWNASSMRFELNIAQTFLYDNWNLIVELAGERRLTCRHLWGVDLSGTFQGAGGIGGLLATNSGGSEFAIVYDGIGNVICGIDASNSGEVASYEYGPFGEPLRTMEGSFESSFGFSTKFRDVETGHIYYGFRFYDPPMGRWLNRDPIEETGGSNLFANCANDLLNKRDILGLAPDETLVVVFMDQVDPGADMDTRRFLAKLSSVDEKLKWRVERGSSSWISKWGIGELRGLKITQEPGIIPYLECWKRIYKVELDMSNSVNMINFPLGYGNSFGAVVFAERVKRNYDKHVRTGVITRPELLAHGRDGTYKALAPFLAAHEVLHAVGATHIEGDDSNIMVPAPPWAWVFKWPFVSVETVNEVRNYLKVHK